MATRRLVLKSVPVLVTSSFFPAKAKASQDCELYIEKLAEAMKALHGGEWKVDINHKSKMAIVVKI